MKSKSLWLVIIVVAFVVYMFACKGVGERGSSSYQLRALEKINLGLYGDALQELDLAVKANPESVEGYYTRCMVNTELDYLERALADCDMAISLDRKSYQGYYYRALTRLYFYDYEESISDFKQAKKYALKDKNNEFARNSHRYIKLIRERLDRERAT